MDVIWIIAKWTMFFSFYARSFFKMINVCLHYFYSIKCLCCARFLHNDDLQCLFKEDKLVFSNKNLTTTNFQLFLQKKSSRFSKMKCNIAISRCSFLFSNAVKSSLSSQHLTTSRLQLEDFLFKIILNRKSSGGILNVFSSLRPAEQKTVLF